MEIGNGWVVAKLEDQYAELTKDDIAYRRATGRDGFVRVYGEPGIARSLLIQRAWDEAQRCDAALADMIVHHKTGKKPAKKKEAAKEPTVDADGNVTIHLPKADMGVKAHKVKS